MTNDERSICAIVEQMETSWNRSDSAGFAAAFAEDAEFVDILGRQHKGRTAIEAGHRYIFDTIYRDSRNHYTVEKIRFVRPDVAIVFVRARLLSRLGDAVDDPQRALRGDLAPVKSAAHARPTMVLSQENRQWQIVAFQNTKIAEALRPATV